MILIWTLWYQGWLWTDWSVPLTSVVKYFKIHQNLQIISLNPYKPIG